MMLSNLGGPRYCRFNGGIEQRRPIRADLVTTSQCNEYPDTQTGYGNHRGACVEEE